MRAVPFRCLTTLCAALALSACADDRPGAFPVLPPGAVTLAPAPRRVDGDVGATDGRAGVVTGLVPSAAAPRLAIDDVPAATLVPLRYADADQLAKVLAPLVGPGGAIGADLAHRALLVSGDATTRATLAAMIRAFDADVLAGQSYAVLPARAGDAKEMAAGLADALRTTGEAAARLRVVPLVRADAVLVVGTSPAAIADATRLFALVQRAERQDTRRWRVFYLQNSEADDVAYVLQQSFTPDRVTAQPRAAIAGASPLGGGTGGRLASSQGGQSGAISGVPTGRNTVLAGSQPQAAAPGRAPPPSASPAAPSSGRGGHDGMRIIPDANDNALLVYATPPEQAQVGATLRRIDTVPAQVRIDAVIAEVTLNDRLQYGTQFYFKSGSNNGILSNSTGAVGNPAATVLGTSFPGFVISGRDAGGAPLAISTLQGVTTVRILSSPQLLVVNDHDARLQVGNLVPYLTGAAQGTQFADAPVISSVGYQPTGVTLHILPRVGEAGQVQLQVSQEVSDVTAGTTSAGGIQSPTFSTRNVTSQIVVRDGDTVGLAGVIRDTVSVGNSGIPWLKDIPLVGFLAGTQTNTRTRNELLVLITPHVTRAPVDLRAATEELRDANINAAVAANALQTARPSGSPDPGRALRRRLRLER